MALEHDGAQVATLIVPSGTAPETCERLEQRVVPSLQTLLGAAIDRDRLVASAVEAEALRRSDEIKTALLRSVSHDLRTPDHGGARGGRRAGVVLDRPAATGSPWRAASRTRPGELSDLIDKLLDLSRLEAGQAEPRTDWCSLEEVVTAAVEGLGDSVGERVRVSLDQRSALRSRRCRPAGARDRQPARERGAVLRREADPGPGSGGQRAAHGADRRSGPRHPSTEIDQGVRAFLHPARQRQASRLGARSFDRPGVHRGQRRQRPG